MNMHISDLQWDRLLAGELPTERAEIIYAHLGGCAACSKRWRELLAEYEAFLARLPHARRPRWFRTRWNWRSVRWPAVAAPMVPRTGTAAQSGERDSSPARALDLQNNVPIGDPDRH